MIRALARRRPPAAATVMLAALLLCSPNAAAQQPAHQPAHQPALSGSATWQSELPVPESAEFEATVLDVTRVDRAPELIGRVRIRPVQGQPLQFRIPYDPALVKPGHQYTITARIVDGGEVLFETAGPTSVFVGGEASRVSLTMTAGPSPRSAAAPLPPPPGADTPSRQLPAGPRPLSPPAASRQPGFGGGDAPLRRIRGMYRARPGGAEFVECGDSRSVAIAPSGDDARLATAYRRTQPQPGQAMLVEVDGRIGIGPRPGGSGLGRVLTVDRFLGIHPGRRCETSFATSGSAAAEPAPTPPSDASAPSPDTSAAAPPPPESGQEPLLAASWQLLSIGDQTIDPSSVPEVPRLQFNRDLPVFSGTDGCNGVRGEYVVIEDSLTLNLGPSTRMACPANAELGQAFREVLERTSAFGVTGDHLTLYDAGGTALARFTARSPG